MKNIIKAQRACRGYVGAADSDNTGIKGMIFLIADDQSFQPVRRSGTIRIDKSDQIVAGILDAEVAAAGNAFDGIQDEMNKAVLILELPDNVPGSIIRTVI